MTCDGVEREDIVERYLNGRLSPELKEEWEQHYFGCEQCAERLATLTAVQAPLRAIAPEIRREIPERRESRAWIWVATGIAAALLIAAGASRMIHLHAPSTPLPLSDLARLDPPAYTPPVLRGIESKADLQFHEAMQAYLRRDYPQAIAGLQATLALDNGADAARFFLGACQLLAGKTIEGTRELRVVAAGHSPFAEEAAFDLAKAELLQGDRVAAFDILRRLSAQHGDFSTQAAQLLARIEGAR